MNSITRDGHMHTPFCPHGSNDPLEGYVEEAIRLGRKKITFTEHFPLPEGVADSDFMRETALTLEEVPAYLEAVSKVKKAYAGKIEILKGFEVDYFEDEHELIADWLGRFGEEIEDGLLSVHFVKYEGRYHAIDCLDRFEALLEETKSVEKIYDLYFDTLLKSIEADLGRYKPKRIGHPTLIRIFNQKYPLEYDDKGRFEQILRAVKERGMALDFNSAGIRKPYCKESYPSGRFLALAKEMGIPFVPGSDSHEIAHMAVLDEISFQNSKLSES